MRAFFSDLGHRLIRQPVAIGAAVNGVYLARYTHAAAATNVAVSLVIALFVKMYSTSIKHLEGVEQSGYNAALADVNSLVPPPGYAVPRKPPVDVPIVDVQDAGT